MAAPVWKFVITDLLHNQVAPLEDYFDLTISRRLNGVDSGSFRVRGDNPAFLLLSSQRCMIKAYRDGTLQANMYVWTAEVVGEDDKVGLQVSIISPAVRMESLFYAQYKQKIAIDPGQDRYRILHHLMTSAMMGVIIGSTPAPLTQNPAEPTVPLHIPYGDFGSPTLYDGTSDQESIAPLSQRLQKLSQGLAGFDWYWQPTETSWWWADPVHVSTASTLTSTIPGPIWVYASKFADVPAWPIRWIRSVATMVAAPEIGTDRSDYASFEYGTGEHNLTGFKLSGTRQYQANRVLQRTSKPVNNLFYWDGYGGSGTWISAPRIDQPTANQAIWGEMSTVTQFESEDINYSISLADQARSLRQEPMRRLEITPISSYGELSDPPNFGVDFNLGDLVNVRIVNPSDGTAIVDGAVRVHAVSWTLKESGAETMSITISEEN